MERIVVMEVADQQGKLIERFRATKFPVRIGRAYDNDLIIDDPFVCPHHCEVTLAESGELVVNDLSSVNGTFVAGDRTRTGQISVAADSQLRIGHTILYFKFPGQAVEATRVDVPLHTVREWPPRSLWVNLGVLLLGVMVMTLWEYLDSYTTFEYGKYFFGKQLPALIAVAGWAAIWSIVSRITAHRFAFLRHATILVTVMLVMTLSDYLLEFLKFGFAVYWPFEIINIAIVAAAISLLLFWHLRLCSDQKRSRLVTAASAIAVVFVGLVQVNDYLDSQEFRSGPSYPANLKPPAFQMVRSKPVDDFVGDAELLRKQIDREIEEQRSEEKSQAIAELRPEK